MKSVFVVFTLALTVVSSVIGAPVSDQNELVSVELEVDRCFLPAREGTASCRANIVSWFYDHEFGECREFTYGGCGGNSNRFSTREICEASCDHLSSGDFRLSTWEKTKYNVIDEIVDFRHKLQE